MEAGPIIERICRLPADFYRGSKSMVQLVSESGIREFPSALAVDGIAAYIAEHPDLVEQWLRWSENKRVLSGWYFARRPGGFVVGLFPEGEKIEISKPEFACAEFIKREVHAMATRSR
jgi:hypothetical protein